MRSCLQECTAVYTKTSPCVSFPVPPSLITTPSPHLSGTLQPFPFLRPSFSVSRSLIQLFLFHSSSLSSNSDMNPETNTFRVTSKCALPSLGSLFFFQHSGTVIKLQGLVTPLITWTPVRVWRFQYENWCLHRITLMKGVWHCFSDWDLQPFSDSDVTSE